MTDTPKPLSATEIAGIKSWGLSYFSPPFQHIAHLRFLRLIATIEQRDEHIEKLRGALVSAKSAPGHWDDNCVDCLAILAEIDEALAATEPKP